MIKLNTSNLTLEKVAKVVNELIDIVEPKKEKKTAKNKAKK